MGRRGPAPIPTATLRLRGSKRVTGSRQACEPQGPAGVPRCPGWLDGESRIVWHHVAGLLKQMGVLTRVDGFALARYCRLPVRWRQAEAFLKQQGEVYPLKDDQGRVRWLQQFPQVSIANNLAQQLTRLEQEFGMTPSARTRVHIEYLPEPAANSRRGSSGRAKPGANGVRPLNTEVRPMAHRELTEDAIALVLSGAGKAYEAWYRA